MFNITINRITEPYQNFVLNYRKGEKTVEEFADLYRFWLDNSFMPSDTLYTKGVLNFIFLLENWKKRTLGASDGEHVFLPFDFSDQYVAGFYVLGSSSETIKVSYILAGEMSGWTHSPTQIYEMIPQKDEMRILLDFQSIQRTTFLAFIDDTIYKILLFLKDS